MAGPAYRGGMTTTGYAVRSRPLPARHPLGLGLVGAALSLALAGCGSGAEEAGQSASASVVQPSGTISPPQSPASPSAGPITPKPSLSTEPGARARPQTVLGTVSVKLGECLLFTPGDMAESWVLSGSTEGMTVGHGYTIEGSMDDQRNPACPQGPTFIVSSFTPAR